MSDPGHAISFTHDDPPTWWRPRVRDGALKFMSFKVVSADRVCVDIEFNQYGKTEPKLVKTHVFERDVSGQWLFTGFAGPDCQPLARPANCAMRARPQTHDSIRSLIGLRSTEVL